MDHEINGINQGQLLETFALGHKTGEIFIALTKSKAKSNLALGNRSAKRILDRKHDKFRSRYNDKLT